MFLDDMDITTFSLMGFTIIDVISFGAQVAMVIGGVVPFIPQYLDIMRSQNADGFSLFVCLALLIANILRIMFWFGKRFELPLLAQSVIMIVTMMVLVELCVRVKNRSEIIASKQRKFIDMDPAHFWNWTDFMSYLEFIASFSLVVGVLTFLFINNTVFIETIGFAAVFTEAMLGAPQFIRNFQNKSTLGMSKKMVGFWTCGDVFKTVYFILRRAPPQFGICGILQVSIDVSIFLQVFLYRNNVAAGPWVSGKPAIS